MQRAKDPDRHTVTLPDLAKCGMQKFAWMPDVGPHGAFAYFYAESSNDCYFTLREAAKSSRSALWSSLLTFSIHAALDEVPRRGTFSGGEDGAEVEAVPPPSPPLAQEVDFSIGALSELSAMLDDAMLPA